jgi:site-specific recombinase XerD
MSLHLHSCGVNATAHMLRHYFASRYYQASGCDLRATQAVMGHPSVATTECYVAVGEDESVIDRMAS